jgi:SpoVK/Ycf46/Vps4 family AAA+-type ATPase
MNTKQSKSERSACRNPAKPNAPAPFASDDKLLEAAVQVFQARRDYVDAQTNPDLPKKELQHLGKLAAVWTKNWQKSFDLTAAATPFTKKCTEHRLNKLEREILAALLLNQLAMTGEELHTCKKLLWFLGLAHKQYIPAMRAMSEEMRLFRGKLFAFDDPESDLASRTPTIDAALVETVLSRGKQNETGWKVKKEEELFDQLSALTQALMKKSDSMRESAFHGMNNNRVQKWSRQANRLLHRLDNTLSDHPQWKLAEIRKEISHISEFTIFMALLGKYLGHIASQDDLFTGGGLARAVSDEVVEVVSQLRLLGANSNLNQNGFICPCGGDMELASSDAGSLEQMEFELAPKAIALLGIGKRTLRGRQADFQARNPTLRLGQMVLSEKVRQALDMALVHARCGKRLIDDWGLGEMIPYGRSPVLLFSGSPGTGKTATAEGIAHELDRSILVVDYSRIQNCFVGQTEKNIVRAFHEAKKQDAVLFWDEADAMFYDRDSTRCNWEVRDVNVLLQQLERFEGVCILATNRKITLDKALERRISLKIEFERPGVKERRQIWQKFLPRKLPLAQDVELDHLSEADLAGGEIKNVVLNAARLALQRNEQGPVSMQDFHVAIEMETVNRWNAEGRKHIGFSS